MFGEQKMYSYVSVHMNSYVSYKLLRKSTLGHK